ncbi:MAG: polysaccharide biosynthesis C-terminal domain-containing protein [Rhodobacteraceae bacterium]|nr:polysaccharide biosynthesis C-terminal domain-containing protein [Paracoccaceae bacterium]
MNNIFKIIGQAFFSLSGKIFVIIIGFWFKYFLANNLDDAAYSLGVFALGMTIVEIISPFSSLGLGGSAARFIPKWKVERKMEYVSGFIQISAFLTLFLSLFFAVLVYWNKELVVSYFSEEESKTIVLSALLPLFLVIMIFKNLTELFIQFLRGFQEIKRSTILTSFVGVTLKVGLVVLLVSKDWDLEGYVLGELVAAALVFVSLGLLLSRYSHFTFQLQFDWMNKEVLSFTGTILLLAILSMVTANLDKVLLGRLSITDLGIYYMALTFIPFIPIVLTSINSIFAPVISQVWSEGKMDELQGLYQFFTKWGLLLSMPIVYMIAFFRKDLLLLFGEEFVAGEQVLLLLAIAHFINLSFGSVGMLLQMTGKHVQMLRVTIIKTIITVLLMFFMIPAYGLWGAAIAVSIGIVLSNVLAYLVVYRTLKFIPYQWNAWRIVLSIGVTTVVLNYFFTSYFSPVDFLSLLLCLLVVTLSFFLAARLFCFSSEDKAVFQHLWAKVSSKINRE